MTEQENKEKSRKLHLAQEAKRILNEPLLEGFFDRQELICLEAFKRMPLGASLQEYQTVHHDLLAGERLKMTLLSYIQDYDTVVLQERREENVAEGI